MTRNPRIRKIIICENCGKEKEHHAKGLCGACYKKQNGKKPKIIIIICKKCKKKKPLFAKKMCQVCYQKQYTHKMIICSACGKKKEHVANGMCDSCNSKVNRGSMTNDGTKIPNKECSTYLGVDISELILSKVFKNVKKMSYGHKGFDFKCSKGMKIDVKSAVLRFNKTLINYKGSWSFAIRRNKIPDYFLCIAYDNRIDLIPQHLWLIPSEKINHLTGTSIAKNKIDKWKEYELPINKVLSCCNELKK